MTRCLFRWSITDKVIYNIHVTETVTYYYNSNVTRFHGRLTCSIVTWHLIVRRVNNTFCGGFSFENQDKFSKEKTTNMARKSEADYTTFSCTFVNVKIIHVFQLCSNLGVSQLKFMTCLPGLTFTLVYNSENLCHCFHLFICMTYLGWAIMV